MGGVTSAGWLSGVGLFAVLVVAGFGRAAGAQTRPGSTTGDLPQSPKSPPNASDEEPSPDEEPAAPPPAPPVRPPPVHARPKLPSKDGMLLLPGGRFMMGSSDPKAPSNERPAHLETVGPFWIDRTEVTVGAYRACVEKHSCRTPERSSATCTYEMGDPLLPISCVRFEDADTYCRLLGKRLPREVEWEFAARGTTNAVFPWGRGASNCAVAATLLHESTGRSCTGRKPSKVGVHPMGASTFGVLDLSGNVEEWTSDWYSESVAGGAAPSAGASHTLRGGGWLTPPSMSRTTSRNWGSSLEAGANVGFRCARDGGAEAVP
jgi:formylglycine-generating enzyme required for sulfatase activity